MDYFNISYREELELNLIICYIYFRIPNQSNFNALPDQGLTAFFHNYYVFDW
jgi:hypothetical protein